MKATAIAPANIAFVKYWGKEDESLRLPTNASISMNLSDAFTVTTVEFSDRYERDIVDIRPPKKIARQGEFTDFKETENVRVIPESDESKRIIRHLDRIRNIAGQKKFARVVTEGNFPASAGIASSASGFAALTVAAAGAAGLELSEKALTVLARIGSGSACRSIPDGFVEWKKGNSSESSYAATLYPATYWGISDVVVIISAGKKKVSATDGMEYVRTSPFFRQRIKNLPATLRLVKEALKAKDFQKLGDTIESEAVNMNAVMMTQSPPLYYWLGGTVDLIYNIFSWRASGLSVYFTVDSGPNVHLICETKNKQKVIEKIRKLDDTLQFIINDVSDGTKLTENHLF